MAKEAGQSIAVDITNHGVQIFHFMMTGTTQVNNEWIERKRRVVSLSNHRSYYLEIEGAKTGITYNDRNLLDASIYGLLITLRLISILKLLEEYACNFIYKEKQHLLRGLRQESEKRSPHH
ncbi:hypothetical protein BVG16_31510 [Paenibacillus selenitireducens]|uniref:Uncharacterized protein n=1 Tax=Paenibacillus selenitireducens TaxID=1324314 RepID=A0A1T2WZ64_9BACL|nr:hypothetical protein BVG16_31510 [Paenibacillus selenitireducens]